MDQELSLKVIIDTMMTPDNVTPAQIVQYYMFLTAIYARHSVEMCDALVEVAKQEAALMRTVVPGKDQLTSAKVKQLVKGTEYGQSVIALSGRLKAIEELIRSLKTAQKYYIEDARNTL